MSCYYKDLDYSLIKGFKVEVVVTCMEKDIFFPIRDWAEIENIKPYYLSSDGGVKQLLDGRRTASIKTIRKALNSGAERITLINHTGGCGGYNDLYKKGELIPYTKEEEDFHINQMVQAHNLLEAEFQDKFSNVSIRLVLIKINEKKRVTFIPISSTGIPIPIAIDS